MRARERERKSERGHLDGVRTTIPPSKPSQEGTCPRARGAWLSQATWTGCEMETGLSGPVSAGAQGTTNVTGSQTRNQGQRLMSPGPLQHTGGRQRAAPECFIPAVLRSPHGPQVDPHGWGNWTPVCTRCPLGPRGMCSAGRGAIHSAQGQERDRLRPPRQRQRDWTARAEPFGQHPARAQ